MDKIDQIKMQISEILECRYLRLTPMSLERMVEAKDISKKDVRSAIRSMVSKGTLRYTHHFNTTHLELNFHRPFQVSKRIILSPNSFKPVLGHRQILIRLEQGDAFGAGDHPTTRLSLRGLDVLMEHLKNTNETVAIKVLDIGTGSGILIIAAILLGAEKGWAVDIDPVALYEAEKNICINSLKNRIHLTSGAPDDQHASAFKIVMANLRPPTLKALTPMMMKVSDYPAYWILSGFREGEFNSLIKAMIPQKTTLFWHEVSCAWMAVVLKI